MEQHPVPQHISSYQFRLIGDMTVRQFAFLAGGCITGLVFYASPLAPIIKWPLIIVAIIIGVALAFMPIQERPLDQWIVAFIKAVFSPTQFNWKKQPKTPEIFKATVKKTDIKKTPPPPPDQKKLAEYLGTLPTESTSPLDQQEENFVKQAINLFQLTKMPAVTSQPTATPQPTTQVPPRESIYVETKPKPTPLKPMPKKVASPVKAKPPMPKKKTKLPEAPTKPGKKPTVEAKFSPELPFPASPTQPNTLVGMVLNPEGKIIEGAIIEIRDSQGIPVRALKSNKLGQFRSVTALKNGQYEIETEKENYHFDILKLNIAGKVVEPLEIRAKGKAPAPVVKKETHGPAQNA